MRVLIVGGTSSLGVALKAAMSGSCEVITAGRSSCDIKLDVSWPLDRIVLPAGLDAVIHTAAHFGGAEPVDLIEAENINVLGTLKVCEAAASSKAGHFVLVSSMFALVKEGSPRHDIYAVSKRHGEDVARLVCAKRSVPLAVLRPSQVYGAGEKSRRHQPFLYSMLDRARNGDDIFLYGTRDPLRNFIYIGDLVAAIIMVVAKRIVGTYSFQHPRDVTYTQVARAAFAAFGTQGTVRFLQDKPDIPDCVFERDDTLYDAIGAFSHTTIEDGLQKAAQLK